MDRLSQGEFLEVFDEESRKWIAASVSYQNATQVLRVCFESSPSMLVPLLGASLVEKTFQGRNIVVEVYPKGSPDPPVRFAFPSMPLFQIWKGVLEKAIEYTGLIACAGYLLWRVVGDRGEWRSSYAVVERTTFATFTDSNMKTALVAVPLVGCKVHVPNDDDTETKTFSLEPSVGTHVEVQLSNPKEFEDWMTAIYGAVMDKSPGGKNSNLKVNERENVQTSEESSEYEKNVRQMRVKNLVESNLIETVDMSGYLLKLGVKVKNWKKRLFTLHANGSLTYSGPDKFGVMEVLGEISLYGATIKPLPPSEYEGRQNLFGIFPAEGGRVYVLQAGSKADADRWVIAMNSYRDKYTPTSEECIFEGYMRKLGEVVPTWKERYFRLYSTNPRLEYFKNERERRRLGVVSLERKCRVQIEPDREDMAIVFSLFATEACRNYLLACSSKQDRKLWIAHIQSLWSGRPGGGGGGGPAPLSPASPSDPPSDEEEMSNEKEFQSGWLMKLGDVRKNWKKRWFVLSTRAKKLKYYEKETDKKATGEIPLLRGATITCLETTSSNKEFCFTVTPAGLKRTYTLQAASEQERESWVTAISKVALRGTTSEGLASLGR